MVVRTAGGCAGGVSAAGGRAVRVLRAHAGGGTLCLRGRGWRGGVPGGGGASDGALGHRRFAYLSGPVGAAAAARRGATLTRNLYDIHSKSGQGWAGFSALSSCCSRTRSINLGVKNTTAVYNGGAWRGKTQGCETASRNGK